MGSLVRGRGRVGRGLTLSAACLAIPAIGHTTAGGGLPSVGPFLFGAGLLCVACVALADRRLSAGGIVALVFASQPAFHVLLSLSAHAHSTSRITVGMVIAHAIAACVLAVLLTGGEAVLWSIAALSAVLFHQPERPPAVSATASRSVRS